MSISNAMQSGVSGLLANSTAVRQISFNIANANTDGYRRSFAQMVSNSVTSPGGGPQGAGVRTAIMHLNDTDGSFRGTGRETNLAINGGGFFVVTRATMAAGTTEAPLLTRSGSFEPDADGYLRNAAGLYLAGYRYDANGELGSVDRNQFSGLETVNVANTTIPGSPSSAVTVSGNLPSQETGSATPGDPFMSSVEYYSPLGAAGRLQFSWQPTSTADQWTLTIRDDAGTDYGQVTVAFNDSGALAGSPASYSGATNLATAPAAFSFDTATGTASLTIDNGTSPQTIEIALGEPGSFDGLTQFSGDYLPLESVADGAQSGMMIRVEIDERGDVWGFFDNGTRQVLYNIPLAEVTNPNGLATQDNNTFLLSRDSGPVRLSTAATGTAGSISSGGVESSNVDIAEELTELIQKQRAYSSNAKIITTADEMLDETMRLKR